MANKTYILNPHNHLGDKLVDEKSLETTLDTAFAEKGGINIGTKDDEIDNGVDENSTGAWTNVKNMNFKGNVTVIKNPETGVLNLYFAKLRETYKFDTMTDVKGDSVGYLYQANDVTGSYSLPTGVSSGGKYSICDDVSSTGTKETLNVNGGNFVTLDTLTSKVKCVITKNGTETLTIETDAIDGSQSTVTKSENGVTITVSDIKKYEESDLEEGFMPDTIDCKVKVEINNASLMSNGGTYKAEVTVNGVTKPTSEVFVWKKFTSKRKVGGVTVTHKPSADTHQVSGVTYTSGGNINISATGIEGTCLMYTSSHYRFKITESINGLSFGSESKGFSDAGVSGSGVTATGTGSDIVYSYNKDYTISSSTPIKLNGSVKVEAYEYNGTVASNTDAAKEGTITDVASYYTCTTKTADTTSTSSTTYSKSNFYIDGARILYTPSFNDKGEITNLLQSATNTTYLSSKSLATDDGYTSQLLVQGGSLKYPSADITGTYNSTSTPTGTKRYYVRPVTINKKGSVTSTAKLKVTVNGLGSNFGTGLRIFLAKKDKAAVVQLNASKGSGVNGNASSTPSSGVWYCDIANAVWGDEVLTAVNNEYYLIIEMDGTGTTSIGAITIENGAS